MTDVDDLPRRANLNLSREEQREAFAHAEAAARQEVGEDASVGDVVQELSSAYVGCFGWEEEVEG